MRIVAKRWRRMLVGMLLAAWLPLAGAGDVVGTLGAIGSDTLSGLMLRWGKQLTDRHPGVRLQLQASGSASAPTALIAGTTRLGPMSRPMTADERHRFAERHGYPPTEIEVARDALVVVVNRHNPLASLSLATLDAIFSDTRRCGGERDITHWRQLGIDRPVGRIELQGRNAASGTYDLFRRHALCDGYFRMRVDEHPGSAAIVEAVASSWFAMGYAGLNHLSPGIRALALRNDEGREVAPHPAQVRSGAYPLVRTLYLYANLPPGETLPGPERALVEQILSAEGQAIVAELGFVTLPEATLATQRRQLGLEGGG